MFFTLPSIAYHNQASCVKIVCRRNSELGKYRRCSAGQRAGQEKSASYLNSSARKLTTHRYNTSEVERSGEYSRSWHIVPDHLQTVVMFILNFTASGYISEPLLQKYKQINIAYQP